MSNRAVSSRKRLGIVATVAPFAYQIIALLCLRHWQSATPWSDLDYFSGGFFLLNFLMLFRQLGLNREIFASSSVVGEASGLRYDSGTIRWAAVLALGDLSVFLDYGHWHLTPALRLLQIPGLVLYAIAIICLIRTNTCLARHFERGLENRILLTTGPFGIVRHPRYASLLLAKLGFALLFASILGWTSLTVSLVLATRRIRLEEAHLRQLFGPSYDVYSHGKRRLLPGIF